MPRRYMAREGATGVILITTKKVKTGKLANVDFNSNATFEYPEYATRVPENMGTRLRQ